MKDILSNTRTVFIIVSCDKQHWTCRYNYRSFKPNLFCSKLSRLLTVYVGIMALVSVLPESSSLLQGFRSTDHSCQNWILSIEKNIFQKFVTLFMNFNRWSKTECLAALEMSIITIVHFQCWRRDWFWHEWSTIHITIYSCTIVPTRSKTFIYLQFESDVLYCI